jgi:hypothetical protein
MSGLAWMAMLPGLPHRLEHGEDGVAILRALRELGGVLEGERLVGAGTLNDALAHAAQTVAGLRVGVAIGPVEGWLDGMPTGIGAHRLRTAVQYARVGEVFALPGIGDVPEGVGRFHAPKAIAEAVGCPVEVLRDYR